MGREDDNNSIVIGAVLTAVVAVITAVLGWMFGLHTKQEEVRLEQERKAYFEMLKITRELDLDIKDEPQAYIDETSSQVRRLLIYGGKEVLEAQISEWKEICAESKYGDKNKEAPPCCGPSKQIDASISVVHSMRIEAMPMLSRFFHHFSYNNDDSDISGEHIIMLKDFCDLAGDKSVCGDEEFRREFKTHCFTGSRIDEHADDIRSWIEAEPKLTSRDIADRLEVKYDYKPSPQVVDRFLKRHGRSLKRSDNWTEGPPRRL